MSLNRNPLSYTHGCFGRATFSNWPLLAHLVCVMLAVSCWPLIVCLLMTSPVEDASSVYALLEFVEEECTAVVPLQRISKHDDLRAGQKVKVLWDNRKSIQQYFFFQVI